MALACTVAGPSLSGMTTPPSPEASATPDAPTLPQSIIVELGLGIIGVILILVTGRSFADAYRVDVAPLASHADRAVFDTLGPCGIENVERHRSRGRRSKDVVADRAFRRV